MVILCSFYWVPVCFKADILVGAIAIFNGATVYGYTIMLQKVKAILDIKDKLGKKWDKNKQQHINC